MRKITRPTCPNPTSLRTNYKHIDNKSALIDAGHGKCMYCEEKILSSQFGDIEHIKPKSKYPQLEFVRDNLGFVCIKCNNSKSNKYDEDTPFLDPYTEDPEMHITILGTILSPKMGSERGELTINEIDLNRAGLLEKRLEKITSLSKAINECYRTKNTTLRNILLESLKNESHADKEYSLCAKFVLANHGIL